MRTWRRPVSDPLNAASILIIDDHEETRYIFRRILVRAGFSVEEAATGSEGLSKALSLPDIVISDVNLPDLLGYEVVRRLKSNALTANIPVLQISASFLSDESKVQALKEGADSYLTQPVEPTVLIAQIEALLRLRRAEALSHHSALQWQTTFDALNDGLALARSDGRMVRANATFMQLLGLVAADIEGRRLADVFEASFGRTLESFLAEVGKGVHAELPHGSRWFRVRYDTITADLDAETGSILTLTDITDHRKLQEMLKLSERLAATGRLAHIIAHEINNPLEAMSNLLYLAANGSKDDFAETKSYVEQSLEELFRISRITKQVLAFHRESTLPTLCRADEMIEGVIALFRVHVARQNVTIQSDLRSSDKLLIHAAEIRQVFNNLIANALDAMESCEGTLRIRCLRSVHYPEGTPGIRFLFSDCGRGIPPASMSRIFEAFYTTKELKGSGIGLWLSSEVIGKHRGDIRVRSRTEGPYRGTLFDVFIPLPVS
jgi:two-component system NtrC family sensor kinase